MGLYEVKYMEEDIQSKGHPAPGGQLRAVPALARGLIGLEKGQSRVIVRLC